MQDDINHYVMRDRLSNVSLRQRAGSYIEKYFPVSKSSRASVWRHFHFSCAKSNCWIFAARNWHWKKAPPPSIGLSRQKRLEVLWNVNVGFNKNDNNNRGLPQPPPSPPLFNNFIPPLQFPLPPPLSFNPFQQQQYFSPPTPPVPSPPLSPLPLPRPGTEIISNSNSTIDAFWRNDKDKDKNKTWKRTSPIDTLTLQSMKYSDHVRWR